MEEFQFRPMVESDWPDVEGIYRAGIATGHATFETAPPGTWVDFAAGKRLDLSFVGTNLSGEVLGWVAASPVSSRAVYAGVVEHSIYVHPDASGRGIATRLLASFIEAAGQVGIWTIQSSIFPDNTSSLRLHERAGFRLVGRRERIARMTYGPQAGQWRDTILVERRAVTVPAS